MKCATEEDPIDPGYFDPQLTLQEYVATRRYFNDEVIHWYMDNRGECVDANHFMMSNSIAQAILRCIKRDK